MAKIIVTFEDVEEGVQVKVESDPPFGDGRDLENLTEAQHMGLKMTHMLTQENHQHDENCKH